MIVFKLTVKGDRQVIKKLDRIRRFPSMTRKAMMIWGKTLERDTKTAARMAGISAMTGNIYGKGIQWRQKPGGKIGRLFIRQSYVFLDSMKPHWVNITRSRTMLLHWASGARNDGIRLGALEVAARLRRTFPVYVEPHPFIREGYMRARPKLGTIIKSQLQQKVTA